jgi:hypothetical protein
MLLAEQAAKRASGKLKTSLTLPQNVGEESVGQFQ